MPEVTKEQAGTYRQISEKLRVNHGPGKGETTNSRPRSRAGVYLDGTEPTLLTLHEGDLVDLPFLIGIGALEPYEPPAPAKEAKSSEQASK